MSDKDEKKSSGMTPQGIETIVKLTVAAESLAHALSCPVSEAMRMMLHSMAVLSTVDLKATTAALAEAGKGVH